MTSRRPSFGLATSFKWGVPSNPYLRKEGREGKWKSVCVCERERKGWREEKREGERGKEGGSEREGGRVRKGRREEGKEGG